MQNILQTVKTLIRLLLEEQSDLDLHCLSMYLSENLLHECINLLHLVSISRLVLHESHCRGAFKVPYFHHDMAESLIVFKTSTIKI